MEENRITLKLIKIERSLDTLLNVIDFNTNEEERKRLLKERINKIKNDIDETGQLVRKKLSDIYNNF